MLSTSRCGGPLVARGWDDRLTVLARRLMVVKIASSSLASWHVGTFVADEGERLGAALTGYYDLAPSLNGGGLGEDFD